MKKVIGFLSVITFFGVLVFTGTASEAKTAAEFYKGKTITFVVPYSPGGSFDLLGRILASGLPKYTGARVVFRNKPGGGGIIGYNYMFKAKPDGLTIGITHGPKMVTSDLFRLQGVKYKADKFTLIGNLFTANNMLAVVKDSPLRHPRDVAASGKSFRIAATKPFFEPHWAEVFGLKHVKVVPGYGGFGEKVAAVVRGEVHATVGAIAGFVAHRDSIKMIALTFKEPKYPDVAYVRKDALPGKQKWVDYMEMWPDLMRMIIAPPGVPPERAKFLEEALHKLYDSKQFKASAARLEAEVRPQFATQKDVKRSVDRIMGLDQKEIEELKYIVEKKYLPK